ncbi:BLUF domain-containing protein [Frigoriflavimonas asaccharolytica]|uniref:BLUF domain-containing protein n=1 Tax=Frigoriflavimonas asaccharolytica TaxID=2735899 RepID=A0A8J8G8M3_9FLAO|nr:BLUF domain-containing protein [Frigoriflavimonas asaccharolytica]NRS91962.1 hypothetical protein [Frigoriflavimonas asaccharolytica]
MIYQLNYRSRSRPDLELNELDEILVLSKTKNTAKNITGCLIYHDGSFVQILEGDKKLVQDLYRKIEADPRHEDVILLWEAPVDKRYFTEWNMAYYIPTETNVVQFVNNMLLLSEFSDRSSASLLSFWSNVRKILRNDNTKSID